MDRVQDCVYLHDISHPIHHSQHNLTRIGLLGVGNFGEVYKAKLQHGPHGVPIMVAVKALKTSNHEARDELLREAALMALLTHANIVTAIGSCRA
jgi:serine/threonine protein kinase